MKRLVFSLLVIAALVAAAAAFNRHRPAPPSSSRPNVVLITVDTLRADRLGRGFTPSIDALAATGGTFVRARTAVPLTLPSHTTIMTGTLPPAHGVRDNGIVFRPGPRTLARTLRDAGYRTGGFVGAFVLNHMFGLDDGFDRYDDRVHRDPSLGAQLEAERRGGEVVDAALDWLGGVPQPFFLWVHLYDPHAPYDPPAEFLAKAGGNAYDGEVAYADAQVGRLTAALAEQGLAGSTIVALAGDHGEGLRDHGERTHGMLAYDSTLRVPLVLRVPDSGAQGSVEESVSLADLAGTLLDAAHVRRPPGMGGVSLLSRRPEGRDVYSETQYPRVAGWHPLSALIDGRWKLIRSSESELYDLSVDPGETRNLASDKTSLVEAMTKRIGEIDDSKAPRAGARVSPEAAERLRALGYVSGSTPSTADAGGAPNPAHTIDDWARFESALSDVTAGRPDRAAPVLGELAARFPSARVFKATYARALKDTGDPRAAVAIYRTAIERWPDDPTLYHDLAVAARAAGDRREAARAEQAALALDTDNAAALNGLGLLQAESGDAVAAAASFERAASHDSSNASYWVNLGNARRATGDLDRAEAAYRRALEIDSAHADAANGLGVVLVQRKRPADAIAFFQQAVRSDPRLHEARLNLAIAYQESGDRDRAAVAYRAVLASAPPGSPERKAASKLLEALGR